MRVIHLEFLFSIQLISRIIEKFKGRIKKKTLISVEIKMNIKKKDKRKEEGKKGQEIFPHPHS